jgi:hypothetical protein
MKKIKQVVIAFSLSFCATHGQTIEMDFRDSHTLENIRGLEKMKLFQTSTNVEKSYYSENFEVSILLPADQKIQTKTQSLKVQAKADGTLIYVQMLGPIMPLDEAYEAGKRLYSAFSVPHDRLEKWKSIADSEGSSAQTVLGGNYDGMYPPVYINVMHSMNKLYPWTISLSFGWNQIKDDQRDEAWGRENNPKPPPGLEIVSLEPPSGKTYDRADAWVEANRRQDELDKKLGQVRGPNGQLISGPQDPPKERAEKPRSSVAVKPTDVITEKSSPFSLWIIVSSIGILIFALTIWLQRRNSKPNS